MDYSGFTNSNSRQLEIDKSQFASNETDQTDDHSVTNMELEQSKLSQEDDSFLQKGSNSSLKVFFYLPNDFNFLKFCYF